MIKKSLLVLVVLALLCSIVSAISINVEDPLTQGSQWSTSVDFGPLDSVEEGKVFVDGDLALVVFEHWGKIFSADVSSKVLNYNINANTVVIAYVGLSEGVHTIEAKTYSLGNVVDEQSASVTFIKPLSQSEKQSLENKISSLESTTINLENTTNTLRSEVNALETTIADKDSEISNLKQKNSELLSDIAKLELSINELESDGATNEEILMTVKDDLNILLTERDEARKSPLAGLFAASASNSTLLLALVALIAVIVIGVFLKKNSSSIYSSSIFSKNDELSIPEEEAETKIIEKEEVTEIPANEDIPKSKGFFSRFKKEKVVEQEAPKKKWAVESYHPAEKESKEDKRFELGDLIKKEK